MNSEPASPIITIYHSPYTGGNYVIIVDGFSVKYKIAHVYSDGSLEIQFSTYTSRTFIEPGRFSIHNLQLTDCIFIDPKSIKVKIDGHTVYGSPATFNKDCMEWPA